ncbi:hypothetical protein GB2207_08126 [marine gamma proteobacterium HTCC2207]|jgi:hypothetical protein|uniref:DUF4426 domain-containing protein n=1 Tax=gamma proteobacterium HTCC2207 TaxID=314287 RepID=Q1YVE8_9GAMM|nr:hypothetical protein GB2207_08126 [marine gamma proteobacterium HTCC2207] [gamma proteobacterium HTCC2207]MBT5105917.1 DUF4426 domain-containing protein [Porticoccaceae bacterium]MBT6115409.1 DUF4426 domain-containing protein [Porticoccaceae bacterium]MBT6593205.1 DUF4426 domain-containing protein [Porticoccaceae bacterium]MDG1080044.1 DUF4426 domain-containing protein [Porticoccaceae bacterium]
MKYLFLLLSVVSLALPAAAAANDKIFKQVGDNKIFFSAFNSTFIEPDVAVANQIVRGKDKGLVNIAVVVDSGTGKPAVITGNVYNIFQMSQTLEFVEVREQGAVYYLAPFEFENEDFLTFKISVRSDPKKPAYDFKFQKKMYHD